MMLVDICFFAGGPDSAVVAGPGGGLPLHEFRSGMGQAFAISILAWTVCFILTIIISLFTEPKKDEEMRGLVYSLTEKPKETTMD